MNNKIITVDVREDIRNGREPFSKIMAAVATLQPEERLLLLAPFEPVPLFDVMAKRGFEHTPRRTEAGDWEVLFSRRSAAPKTSLNGATPAARPAIDGESQGIELDVRGLEPPQPLVKILETVAALPGGTGLRARTDRRPMHLYAALEERGFTGITEEQPDGSFITNIRR